MALNALIFDFDGTLAETERDGHRVAYNEAFERLGLGWVWSPERYGELLAVAGGKERILAYIAQSHPDRLTSGDAVDLARRIHAIKIERFAQLAPMIELRPGVVRLIADARAAGLRLAVATTASESGVRAVLAKSPPTLAAFDLIAAGDVVPKKKPAPDIYRYALAHLGIDAPEAMAFEDSAIGLRSARAAGIETIVTPSIYTRDEDFSGASAILSSLGEPARRAVAIVGPAPSDGLVSVDFLRTMHER